MLGPAAQDKPRISTLEGDKNVLGAAVELGERPDGPGTDPALVQHANQRRNVDKAGEIGDAKTHATALVGIAAGRS